MAPIDLKNLATHVKNEAEAKIFILDSMKDHFTPTLYKNRLVIRCSKFWNWFISKFLCLERNTLVKQDFIY
jgi:hypothetical protein